MRILLCSHGFSPAVGGIETVSLQLAKSMTRMGEDVRVCTRTAGAPDDDHGLTVIRCPDKRAFAEQLDWADVVLQNNISLPWVWPTIRSRKPWVCANHTWPRDSRGRLDWRGRLKRRAALLAGAQLGVSQVQARQFLGKPVVVGNPYDDDLFKPIPGVVRDCDLLFLGRLTHDKGVDLAIRALPAILTSRREATLTVIGRGELRAELEGLVAELGLGDRVRFLGALFGQELLVELSRHRVVVVPSRACESFGIVVLEVLGCGCVVVASDCGGLPEAVGPAGAIFPVGDLERLSEAALNVLESDGLQDQYRAAAPSHLERFTSDAVAARYLEVLRRVASGLKRT